MTKFNSTKKIGLGILIAVLAIGGYRFVELRKNADVKVGEIEVVAEKAKTEIVDLYRQRVELLETWEKAAQKAEHTLPDNLKLTSTVHNAKTLKLDSENDITHFDFVQNQVSQAIGEYLQSDIGQKTKPKGLEKLEESINFERRAYHVAVFEVESLRSKYRLKSPRPLIFPAERMLKDRGLFR
jgi:hypothetical protein